MSLSSVTVYRAAEGLLAQRGEDCFILPEKSLDTLFVQSKPSVWVQEQLSQATPILRPETLLPPIESQEVWAAGLTYLRNQSAPPADPKIPGFDDLAYDGDRPQLFFKATPHRVSGTGGKIGFRHDATSNIPEPEIALAINREGTIFGYTIGNDVTARDLCCNPLYLSQAKVFNGCCSLGPGIIIRDSLPRDTTIQMHIWRDGVPVFSGETRLDRMKRSFPELAAFLFRENDFPAGCFLLTGAGCAPPPEFTMASGDEVRIHIAGLGSLINIVA